MDTEHSVFLLRFIKIIFGVLILTGLYIASLYSYILFHFLAEMFSIVIACAMFLFAWNARRFLKADYLLFLGIAYFFVAGMDVVHTLAYTGMNIFTGYGTNLATQLWIVARYMESISLLLAPFFLSRRLRVYYALSGYTLVSVLLLVSIFHWHIFPSCFVEETGLTPFKKISEYIISIILLCAIGLLVQRREQIEKNIFRLLFGSILMSICSELAFTFYVHAYGLSNLVGHYLKIISFYLIYKAIIETGLLMPFDLLFRDLKKRESGLRLQGEIASNLSEGVYPNVA